MRVYRSLKGRGTTGKDGRRRAARIILAICFLYVLVLLVDQQLQIASVGSQRAEIARQIAVLKEANAALERELELLRTNAYVERVAREQLGLIKPGEIPYVIMTEEQYIPDRPESLDTQ